MQPTSAIISKQTKTLADIDATQQLGLVYGLSAE